MNVNNQVAQMAATYMDLDPGNDLPDFELWDANNERSKLSDHVNKLSVLYWSIQNNDYAMGIHDQVKDLQIKYPEIEFIGINIDIWFSKNGRMPFCWL
jgi:peroxiredoxin